MNAAKDHDMDGKDKPENERSCLTAKDIVDWNLELRTNIVCMDEHNTDQRKKKFEELEKFEYQRRQAREKTSDDRERANVEKERTNTYMAAQNVKREKQNDVREMSNHDRELKNRKRERVNDERELKIKEQAVAELCQTHDKFDYPCKSLLLKQA